METVCTVRVTVSFRDVSCLLFLPQYNTVKRVTASQCISGARRIVVNLPHVFSTDPVCCHLLILLILRASHRPLVCVSQRVGRRGRGEGGKREEEEDTLIACIFFSITRNERSQ